MPFHKQLMQIKYPIVFHPLKLGPLTLVLEKLENPYVSCKVYKKIPPILLGGILHIRFYLLDQEGIG
jgi:hypothetical protein